VYVSKTCIILVFGFILGSCPVGIQAAEQSLSPPTHFPAEDQRFAIQARNLQLRNWIFDDIFAALCRTALTNA